MTADAGVLACVSTAGPHGVCDDHYAWRSFVTPLRIIWSIRRWWPNELGREMDSAGRDRHRRGLPLVTDGQIHGKLLDDTPCCPIAADGAFSTVFRKVVTCRACLTRMKAAGLTEINDLDEFYEGHNHNPLNACSPRCPVAVGRP